MTVTTSEGVKSVKQHLCFWLCFSSYLQLQVLSAVLGFQSGNWALTPYVTIQVVGVEKLAEAHGILMFFGGVGLVLGPPVVGKPGQKVCGLETTQRVSAGFGLCLIKETKAVQVGFS